MSEWADGNVSTVVRARTMKTTKHGDKRTDNASIVTTESGPTWRNKQTTWATDSGHEEMTHTKQDNRHGRWEYITQPKNNESRHRITDAHT